MSLDWRPLTASMTRVQALVHLAARYDSVDEERIRADLLSIRRKAYNDELEIQAGKVGCLGLRGRLSNGNILSALNDVSKADAVSIANTYNYYLALEIIRARQANIYGNRYYYAKWIREWQPTYWAWKDRQILTTTVATARKMALQDFYTYNGGIMGTAKLEPRTAVCPICQGWIARGVVALRVALNFPPPYHISCPHFFTVRAKHVTKEDCELLWMGE